MVVQVAVSEGSAESPRQEHAEGADVIEPACAHLDEEVAAVMRGLIDVCTNRIPHAYMGMCPDSIEGHDVRDHDCPACAAVQAAERLLVGRGH